ncbi:hypothetical protein QYM36_010015 [Artemia franciscana]|uniref:RRM domain-containing protein n=1 Tax=Artemia franciscana TaxID=6661 RepID=A0AA88I4E8_ARTSF|nr:hypothetical protein QYM36_010015 [Artemia franciscana]
MASKLDMPSSSKASSDLQSLVELGLDMRVADQLIEIFKSDKLTLGDLDDRAIDAIKEFPVDCALAVLKQFMESNLEHVSNKSAFLCGVMKTYRQKARSGLVSLASTSSNGSRFLARGPDEEKIDVILKRTGFCLDVTTGQRKYGGPPPNWEGPPPGPGCEVFVGKIPKDMYEDEIIPLFEQCGSIWDLRLMMDPLTGMNRGYAFVTFTGRDGAQEAVRKLDEYEVKPGKTLKVNVSIPNLKLFVGNIPKSKGKQEIKEEFSKYTTGLSDVIIYSAPDDKRKNRGFCFLEYDSHKSASVAKRRLSTGRFKAWNCDIIVDWADPQEEPDTETMSKVKVLYVRNLTQDITEEKLKQAFEVYGVVERAKKIKDYAFVHFDERDNAIKAINGLNGKTLENVVLEVSLAKPPSDRKKKEEMLRARERRVMQMFMQRGGFFPSNFGSVPRGRVDGGSDMRGLLSRPEYEDSGAEGGSSGQGGKSNPVSRQQDQSFRPGASRPHFGPWTSVYNSSTEVWYRDDSFGASWN